jgi:hypothetical protein
VAHDAGDPTNASPHQERLSLVLDFQDLGATGSKRIADQAAGFRQDLVKAVGPQREITEVGQHLHPFYHLRMFRHFDPVQPA